MSFDVFKGVSASVVTALRGSGGFRQWSQGESIFAEGEWAEGIYVILNGEVDVFRATGLGEVLLSKLGPGDVLGEMGFLGSRGRHTASARATQVTTVYRITARPQELADRVSDTRDVIRFVRNLFIALADRLEGEDDRGENPLESVADPIELHPDTSAALQVIEAQLPSGLIRRFRSRKRLDSGDILCRQGERADGFYFVRSGRLEVFKENAEGESRLLGAVRAPSIVGAEGYFSRRPRTSTLRAAHQVEYVHFSADEFERINDSDPRQALEVICAAAQLAVVLILAREKR